MKHTAPGELEYFLGEIKISDAIGSSIELSFTGNIECVGCARKIKKTFNQGYCYPCFQSRAGCDICIVKPELCHFAKGTCREPEWGEENCRVDHLVYLSNSTDLKVGITRLPKKFERWGDQGAVAGIELAIVSERLHAGLIEVALKEYVSDKTDWRGLIKGVSGDVDLVAERERLAEYVPKEFESDIVDFDEFTTPHEIIFPVNKYPAKAKTLNFDKTPEVKGVLEGIRGQYLFVDGAALNMRKFAGYELEVSV